MSYKLTNNGWPINELNGASVNPETNTDYHDWLEEGNTPEPADPPSLESRQAVIKAQLAALDQRKIRPLAEGDSAYLATLNAQTLALRAELATL